MQDTTVTVTRSGTALQTRVRAIIEEQSVQMGAYYNERHPYDVFTIFIQYATMGYQRGDLITDEFNKDPSTNAPAVYRVVGTPRAYIDGHVELVADRFVGNA